MRPLLALLALAALACPAGIPDRGDGGAAEPLDVQEPDPVSEPDRAEEGAGTTPDPRPAPPTFAELVQLTPKPAKHMHAEWGQGLPDGPKVSGIRFTMSRGGQAIVNFGGTGQGGIQAPMHAPRDIELCWFDGNGVDVRWGAHFYGWQGTETRNRTTRIRGEHGRYIKSCWDAKYDECLWTDIGSQALQFVWRNKEAMQFGRYRDPYGTGRKARIEIVRNGFREVGQPTGARPSYAVSIFEATVDVDGQRRRAPARIARDVSILESRFEARRHTNHEGGGESGSYGAIMVHGHRDVVLRDLVVHYRAPNRAVVQVWDCDSLTVSGGEFDDPWDGATLVFDIRGVDHVAFEGVRGDWVARVYRSTAPWYTDHPRAHLEVEKVSGEDFELDVP